MQKKKKILFVCIGNMIRSQMAEGFAREFAGSDMEIYSAGVRPTGVVSDAAIAVMGEKGIDISEHQSKGVDEVPLMEMDCIVNISGFATSSFCPPSCRAEMLEWDIEDPLGHARLFFREARDEIEQRVKKLIGRLWAEDNVYDKDEKNSE